MRHRRTLGVLVACVVGVSVAARAFAGGPYTDDLSKCLVRSTSDADRTLLVQWMFAMMALHPAVKSMSTVSDSQRMEMSRQIAGVMENLLTVSCQSEAQQALKYEGKNALETGFSILGQVAGRELFSNPQVAAGISELEKYVDADKLKKALQPEK